MGALCCFLAGALRLWQFLTDALGDIMGIPATGKQMHIPEVSIFRYVDGKTVEVWIIGDSLTMMQQLGVIPTLGQVS
jgi:predicted ester cyclase